MIYDRKPLPTTLTGTLTHSVAPSNIALIKYWGKRDATLQWPANDSLSMTLSQARTETWATIAGDGVDRVSLLGSAFSENQAAKALRHLNYLRERTGFTQRLHVETWNSFPASAGIASSASGFAALTLAAIGAWSGAHSLEHMATLGYGPSTLANLARRGSGSACRSLHGGFVHWEAGESPESQSVTSLASASHWDLCDLIVVFSQQAKAVGSTEAHEFAKTSPLFQPRLAALPERLHIVRRAVQTRDFAALGREVEAEALEMHSVMMTSTPSVHYMSPASSRFLAALRKSRHELGTPAYFTMDAGPNVHVLCERRCADQVLEAIQALATDAAENQNFSIIQDAIGTGPSVHKTEVPLRC